MMDELLSTEGPIFSFLEKVGQLILLSLVWIIGCIPIVTIGTSTTALYYAVSKSVRREYGTPLKEFWSSYKANVKRGVITTVVMGLIAAVLILNIYLLTREELEGNNFLLWGSVILLAVLAGTCVYICPVLSRFSMKAGQAWKLAFVMAVKFIPRTLLVAAGTVALVYLQIFVLPIPTVLLLPGIWCLAVTYPMEKCLLAFMPPKEENDDSWYYQ